MAGRSKYRKTDEDLKRKYRPESLVSSYGYDPHLSEGSVIPPIFLSSTFVFPTAEEGERSFRMAYHLGKAKEGEHPSLIYSRLNNPDLEILEDRLTLFEKGTEKGAVFSSGMGAIATLSLALLRQGDSLIYSAPVYGGTDHLFSHILPQLGIRTIPFDAGAPGKEVEPLLREAAKSGHPPRLVFVETPANPTCTHTDVREMREAIDRFAGRSKRRPYLAVDNTFLGPMWQHPAEHGADLVVYSATKFLGGHSDVVAGAVLGPAALVENEIKTYRTMLGTNLGPFEGYLLLRSLNTLKMRMKGQMVNAQHVAEWLDAHPKVVSVHYPGLLQLGDPQRTIFDRQCSGAGSMITFYLKGGKREAFRFLNALEIFHLAVSLGSTESLAEHPATMTHSDLDPDSRLRLGITDQMIRLSIGAEHYEDLIADLSQALDRV